MLKVNFGGAWFLWKKKFTAKVEDVQVFTFN